MSIMNLESFSNTQAATQSKPLVCLQTMWRSCGTYFWNKFRKQSRFMTFIEPDHEKLLFSTSEMFEADRRNNIISQLRHPELDQHYFAEFPFNESGGVPNFKKRFSFESFHKLPEDEDEELKIYLGELMALARQRGKQPVAKFCRFGMSTGWLKKTFGAVTLYLLRDPDAMFRSYWSFGERCSYFICGMILLFSKNQASPMFSAMANEYGVPYIERDTVHHEINEAYEIVKRLDIQALRDIFLLLWALTLKHNIRFADAIVDIDLLAINQAYRRQMELELAQLIGMPFSFDDVQRSTVGAAPGEVLSVRGSKLIGEALSLLPAVEQSARFSGISSASRTVVTHLF